MTYIEATELLQEVPESFRREFMAHRHFWAAKDIDIIARKDGKEYRLEADWLKPFIRKLVEVSE